MAKCDNCGASVSERYKAVNSDNNGTLHACSNCTDVPDMFRGAGGGV